MLALVLVATASSYWNPALIMDDDEYVAQQCYGAGGNPVTAAAAQQLRPTSALGPNS